MHVGNLEGVFKLQIPVDLSRWIGRFGDGPKNLQLSKAPGVAEEGGEGMTLWTQVDCPSWKYSVLDPGAGITF